MRCRQQGRQASTEASGELVAVGVVPGLGRELALLKVPRGPIHALSLPSMRHNSTGRRKQSQVRKRGQRDGRMLRPLLHGRCPEQRIRCPSVGRQAATAVATLWLRL